MKKTHAKKAQIKTLEALIAVTFTFVMINFIIPTQNVAEAREPNLFVLESLQKDDSFRQCITLENTTCINNTLANTIPAKYSFTYNISSNSNAKTGLPDKKVFADSAMIAGNTTQYNPKIIRVYYWAKG